METDAYVLQSVADPEDLQPVPPSPFIQTFTLPDDAFRLVLYDAQGKELPLELTMYDGPTGGWGKETVELELLNQIAGTILLIGIAVSAVRLRRLRRQEGAARQEDAQQNGQGQSKR